MFEANSRWIIWVCDFVQIVDVDEEIYKRTLNADNFGGTKASFVQKIILQKQ